MELSLAMRVHLPFWVHLRHLPVSSHELFRQLLFQPSIQRCWPKLIELQGFWPGVRNGFSQRNLAFWAHSARFHSKLTFVASGNLIIWLLNARKHIITLGSDNLDTGRYSMCNCRGWCDGRNASSWLWPKVYAPENGPCLPVFNTRFWYILTVQT